jgi:hypothetical protein
MNIAILKLAALFVLALILCGVLAFTDLEATATVVLLLAIVALCAGIAGAGTLILRVPGVSVVFDSKGGHGLDEKGDSSG